MDLRLNGKRALITGSTSGIGEQIAKTLAHEGVQVILHGRRSAEADRVVREISYAGGDAVAAIGELGSDEETAKVVEKALAAFGGADILVNNAGAFPMKLWMQSSAAEWVDLYNSNIGSVVRFPELGQQYQLHIARDRTEVLRTYLRSVARKKSWIGRDATEDALTYEGLLRVRIFEEALHGLLEVTSSFVKRYAASASKTHAGLQ